MNDLEIQEILTLAKLTVLSSRATATVYKGETGALYVSTEPRAPSDEIVEVFNYTPGNA